MPLQGAGCGGGCGRRSRAGKGGCHCFLTRQRRWGAVLVSTWWSQCGCRVSMWTLSLQQLFGASDSQRSLASPLLSKL